VFIPAPGVKPIGIMSLHTRINRHLNEIKNTPLETMVERAENLHTEASSLNKRHELKRKRELERLACEIDDEVQDVRSGNKTKRFMKSVEPYVVAQAAGSRSICGDTDILNKYAANFENEPIKSHVESNDTCKTCKVNMKLHAVLAVLVCQKCGETREYLEATSSMLSYDSDNFDFSSFSYRRVGHLFEWLTSLQAKEATDIPMQILEEVMGRLRAERVSDVSEITVHRVREVLKKLKLRRYYEHAQLVLCKITGKKPPIITHEQTERITVKFLAASSAFERHRPPNRSNFLSYAYCLAKICEILGYDDLLPYFSYLKSRDKLQNQDTTWHAICQDLGWTFKASVS
jgi:predicted RNA-binding Zn-ribbon protein involved in translation (DUF1610 family)